ncbi:MAG: Asp-tRNA(Asn)/Glu-tRNA(Gln) amidotransferase GatCAB subunit, partial [Armatimonadetes bacterium]|nr:Asp-tRNA(Asn)/Glu-tRNA(Gln) amidotransferase GatCAB subunit [Armatimonadota bacterium]
MSDLLDLSLSELSAQLRAGNVSPVEATTACLERIGERDGVLNSFLTVLAEPALAEARAREAELAEGRWRGPLHGVPIALKDLIHTAGVRTTSGSDVLREWVPDRDATVVRRLREAGAVLLGKLNMHEHAFGATSENPHFGPVRNPHDPERIAGGSSGGSAAAVAAGLCYGSLGSGSGADCRRLQRRLRGGGGRRAVLRLAWLRHRRLHPVPRRPLWHRGAEADLRARLPCRGAAAGVVAGPHRPDGTHGDGRGADARGDRGVRSCGCLVRPPGGAPVCGPVRGRRARAPGGSAPGALLAS